MDPRRASLVLVASVLCLAAACDQLGQESPPRWCEGLECGFDPDGAWCGDCERGSECVTGQCMCTTPCGTTCCPYLQMCDAETCVCDDRWCADYWGMPFDDHRCEPACDGLECGDDGCGGTCGECKPGATCGADGLCVCPNEPHTTCEGSCCAEGETCFAGECCQRSCADVLCGDDGCGGRCRQHCEDGYCGTTAGCVTDLPSEGVRLDELVVPDGYGDSEVDDRLLGARCRDVDGGGWPTNQLGSLLDTLAGFGIDARGELATPLGNGSLNLLVTFDRSSLESGEAPLTIFFGRARDDGDLWDVATDVMGYPFLDATGSVEGDRLAAQGGILRVPVMMDGLYVPLVFYDVRLEATIDDSQPSGLVLRGGSLTGVLFRADIDGFLRSLHHWCRGNAEAPSVTCEYAFMADMSLIETFVSWDSEVPGCGKTSAVYGVNGEVIDYEEDCRAMSACAFFAGTAVRVAGFSESPVAPTLGNLPRPDPIETDPDPIGPAIDFDCAPVSVCSLDPRARARTTSSLGAWLVLAFAAAAYALARKRTRPRSPCVSPTKRHSPAVGSEVGSSRQSAATLTYSRIPTQIDWKSRHGIPS